jgi:hypothetical protein
MKRFRICIVLLLLLLGFTPAYAQHSYSSGPHYGGGHHTTSHGGHYAGSQNSHHKGGHYRNPKTNNRYGKHKP